MTDEKQDNAVAPRVNFFLPQPGFMSREVRLIKLMLVAWLIGAFVLPLLLAQAQHDILAARPWSEHHHWSLPLHFLVSGQGFILFFILICVLFNLLMDLLTARRRGPRR